MDIRMIGINHDTAPVEWREGLSLTETRKIELLDALMALDLKEAVLLSTCGRFELYLAGATLANEALISFIEQFVQKSDLESHSYLKVNGEAIAHLFRVAIGLDSAVLGEDQILGQVKEAAQFAMTVGSSGKVLNRLFRDAVASAKAVKTTLKLSEHPLSLSYIGVKRVKALKKNLSGATVLMVGLGKMGQLAVKSLLDEGISNLTIAVRQPSKQSLEDFKDERIRLVSYEERYQHLAEADLVIGATAAPHLIIQAEKVAYMKPGAVLLDLALPRDLDPELSKKFDVTLLDVDALKDISEENAQKRAQIGAEAEGLIREDISAYMEWLETIHVDHMLHLWHDDIAVIHEDTMVYLRRKLAGTSSREMLLIDRMLESSLKRFIRRPLNALKDMKDPVKREQAVALLEELFAYESLGNIGSHGAEDSDGVEK